MQKKKLIIIFSAVIFFGLFGLAKSSEAATYYVRTDGNNSCNGTTDAGGSSGSCAFRTILKGIQTAQPGDAVTVHTGSYSSESLASVRSGFSENPITIKAATGEIVSIANITLSHDYIKIDGFRVTYPGPWGYAGAQISGNYNQILNNTFLGVGSLTSGGIDSNGVIVWGNYNTISYNTFDGQNNGLYTTMTRAYYVSGSHNEFTYNTIKNLSTVERVFEAYGDSNRIANNEVYGSIWDGRQTSSHPDIFQWFGDATANILVENNYFHDMQVELGNISGGVGTKTWTFRNNIFANIYQGIGGSGTGANDSINWYNNTFYHCAYNPDNNGFVIYGCGNSSHYTARNNAFIASGLGATTGWYNCVNADYDFVSNTATGGAKTGFSETHGVNGGNPQFTSYNNDCVNNTCNFHVGAGSALVNVGTVVSGYATDKDGVTRPQGSAWDIGAYENASGGGGGDTTAPAAPNGLSVQ